MTHATVLVVIHGARSDYVRRESMPFLSGLAKEGINGSLEGPLGSGHGASLFTGTYPDSANAHGAFTYDPDERPFGCVRRLRPMAQLMNPPRNLAPLRLAITTSAKSGAVASDSDGPGIPPWLSAYMSPFDDARPLDGPGALGAPSLFDLCRANGLRYRYLARPKDHDDDVVYDELVRDLRASAKYDLYVARMNVLEHEGHQRGPHDPVLQATHLRRLDERLASIHAALVAGYDSWELFVVGDHGMAPVERRVDVAGALSRAAAEPAKDYVASVHSTFALIWYLTAKGKQAVEAVLPNVAATRVVGPEERRRLRIPAGAQWGDTLLVAEPGVVYGPDAFRSTKATTLGMHGYLDKATETHGAAVLMMSDGETAPRHVGRRPLVDVFATLCDLLNLPVPPGQEGATLVGLVRMHPPNRPSAGSTSRLGQETTHA